MSLSLPFEWKHLITLIPCFVFQIAQGPAAGGGGAAAAGGAGGAAAAGGAGAPAVGGFGVPQRQVRIDILKNFSRIFLMNT